MFYQSGAHSCSFAQKPAEVRIASKAILVQSRIFLQYDLVAEVI